MINIRYHIVSITAVFLALGIGVALGSTFLDRATVDVLDRNITSAEKRIKETNAENERLDQAVRDARDRDDNLLLLAGPELLAGRLDAIPMLIVAAPGVDDADLESVRTTLVRSGADLRATVLLRDKLAFAGNPDTDLADQLGVPAGTATAERDAVNQQLVEALTAASDRKGLLLPEGVTAPKPPGGEQPAVITALADRDYLKIEPGPDATDGDPILEGTGYRYVYVGGPDLTAAQNDILMALLPGADGLHGALPATVTTASQVPPADGTPAVPTVVARVRSTLGLRERYNTVDQLDTFAGLVATVLTTEHLGEVAPGQYGQGDGASAVLPPAP